MKYGKIWGVTKPLLVTPFIEVHEIDIEPHAKCSEHRHAFKSNMFYCLEGKVTICAGKLDYSLIDRITLARGECTQVPPVEVHWFETGAERARVLEVYYPVPLSTQDIERMNVGSIGVHPPRG